jgi:hypothetical protein
MPKFEVIHQRTTSFRLEVEAETSAEACALAWTMTDQFEDMDNDHWELVSVVDTEESDE